MNATVEYLESSIEALIKDRDELQEKIIAMCKAIPDYDWSGDSEKRIANLAKERDGLKVAAKLANDYIEWTAYGNCRASEAPLPTAWDVTQALKKAGVQ